MFPSDVSGSQSRISASQISAVCEGLESLDAELQHYHAGFGELLSKVNKLQQVVATINREYRGPDNDAPVGLGPSPGHPGQTHDGTRQPQHMRATTRRQSSTGSSGLKLMTCWTALRTLHDETYQSAVSAYKQFLTFTKATGRASTEAIKAGAAQSYLPMKLMDSLVDEEPLVPEVSPDPGTKRCPFSQAWLPQSNGRLLWDFVGFILLCYDAIVIPVEMAWGLEAEGVRYNIGILALVYWTIDFFTNFNTAYFDGVHPVLSHWRIALHYLRTWLLPDALLVTLDYIQLILTNQGALRGGRFIKISRLVRLSRVSKTGVLIDNMAVVCGLAAEAIIVLPILKTLICILAGAHMVSCAWFWIGRSSVMDGDPSWLVPSGYHVLSFGGQYVRAFWWVLCQFTPATTDVSPQNEQECAFAIVIILVCVTTMGASLGRIATAMQQLNSMKFGRTRRLREMRLYLLDQKVPPQLSKRILAFADYNLQQTKEGIHMDYSLISVKLKQELLAQRCGDIFSLHPLMHSMLAAFPDVLVRVFEDIAERVYEKDECVFRSGSMAQGMHIITNGDFLLKVPTGTGELSDTQDTPATCRDWFTDVALFTQLLHVETLMSKKFGKACMLEGIKFARLLQGFPSCAEMVVDYASRYLRALRGDLDLTSDCLRARAQQACENTQALQWFTGKLSLLNTDYCPRAVTAVDEDLHQHAQEFVRKVLEGSVRLEEAVLTVPDIFPELKPEETCIYTRFHEDLQRYRAGASTLSVLSLLANRYDLFTAAQCELDNCMSKEVWEEMQHFVQWAGLSAKAIHSVLVFLVIRGAGKIKSLVDHFPLGSASSPEAAVVYMIENLSKLLPSVAALDEESYSLLSFLLEAQNVFRIEQFLQGENVPHSVACLAQYVKDYPAHYYPAYLLSFVGIMCGINGDERWEDEFGSSFMAQENALMVLDALRALQQLTSESPHRLYWGYMETRARRLDVPLSRSADDEAHKVLTRLLCLSRAQDIERRRRVEHAFQRLDDSDKRILESHLLADGSNEQPTYFLLFLPACLANALANPAVGLEGCLARIAEIYGMLDARRSIELAGGKNVFVDLSEFSSFIAQVMSATIFNQCVEKMKVRGSGQSLHFSVSSKNWSRVQDNASSELSVFNSVKQILRQQETMKEVLKQLITQIERANHRAAVSHGKDDVPALPLIAPIELHKKSLR